MESTRLSRQKFCDLYVYLDNEHFQKRLSSARSFLTTSPKSRPDGSLGRPFPTLCRRERDAVTEIDLKSTYFLRVGHTSGYRTVPRAARLSRVIRTYYICLRLRVSARTSGGHTLRVSRNELVGHGYGYAACAAKTLRDARAITRPEIGRPRSRPAKKRLGRHARLFHRRPEPVFSKNIYIFFAPVSRRRSFVADVIGEVLGHIAIVVYYRARLGADRAASSFRFRVRFAPGVSR